MALLSNLHKIHSDYIERPFFFSGRNYTWVIPSQITMLSKTVIGWT